jgi:hypothetical protein
METPTIKHVKTKDGSFIWQVSYAGMVKEHQQSWQAMIFYHQLMECYQCDVDNLSILLHDPNSMSHVVSTKTIIQNDPSVHYVPNNMEQD